MVTSLLLFLILLHSFGSICPSKQQSIRDFVLEFEQANVRHTATSLGSVHRRDTSEVDIEIKSAQREFHLRLVPNERVFSRNVKAITIGKGGSKEISFDRRQYKIGYVKGISNSRVHGHWDPVSGFDGVIHLPDESFHVEPASRYVEGQMDSYTSVLYKESDVTFNGTFPICSDLSKKLLSIQNSATVKQQSNRKRRFVQFDPEYNTCPVFVIADHLFYSGPGESSEPRTITEMTYHIEQANQMFRETDFTPEIRNIGFRIDKILIYTDESSPDNPFIGNFEVDELLDTFSELDISEHCLGHLFTYRDFDSGVIGLAWVGGTGKGSGGVCEMEKTGTNQGERSLNTGLTSLLNYGRTVPRSISAVTTTHELGHNFGSPHDSPGSECAPGGSQGNFIMYASATDGNLPNNRKFSQCSAERMGSVISAKWSLTCFTQENRGPQCGNGVIEEGEECDCGSSDAEECRSVDPCCTPGNCTLLDEALCSPLLKPCCNNSCIFTTSVCRLEEECAFATYCNGTSGDCPKPEPKPDNEPCDGGAKVCQDGMCSGSICSQWSSTPCSCSSASQACHVCCQSNGICQSTENQPGANLTYLPAGTPCLNLTGYCTQQWECKVVDNQTPLDDLKDILNKINLGDIGEWMKDNWYVAVGGLAGLIVFLVILHFTYRQKYPEQFVKGRGRERQPLLTAD